MALIILFCHTLIPISFLQVRYTVTTNGTAGISQVLVQFVFADITSADLPLTQKFSVKYNSVCIPSMFEVNSKPNKIEPHYQIMCLQENKTAQRPA